MQTGVIIRRNAKQFIPNDYLEKALAANPHGWGAAITTDEGLQVNQGGPEDLEFFQETMKTFPDNDITFYFFNSEAGVNEDDVSPFVILAKDDNPLVVAFVEGNFPSFAKADSSHPPEYFFAHEYLVPKFEGLAELSDDLSKMMEQVKKPYFKKELLLNSVSRGTVTLVAADGTSLTFAQGDTCAEYPWGWVSNNYGYAAGAPKEEEKKEKPKSAFPSRSTVREPANGGKPSDKIAEAVKAPETGAAIIKNYTTRVMKPPGHLSRSERKDWYKQKIGYFPPAGEKGVEIHVAVSPDNKLMTFSDIKKLGMEAAAVVQMLATKNPARGKNTETDNIPEVAQPPQEKQVSGEILPLMSPSTRDYVKKLIAENAEEVMDPVKIKALQAKFADFATQVGAKSINDFKYTYEMLYQLAKDKPDGIAVLCWNALNIVHSKEEKTVEQELKVEPKKSAFPKRGAA